MTFRNRPTVDSPLADLIAGRIDQATYRRRMADLERHAADSLDVEPAPARRRPEPERSGFVIVWMAVAFGLVLLAIAVAGIVATLAAPRTTHQPTVELGSSEGTTAGAGDTALTVNLGASAAGSSGAPHRSEATPDPDAGEAEDHTSGAP